MPAKPPADSRTAYDAIIVVSFGGPEGPDDVIPFLERVTAGREIPVERLRLVGQHYFDRGGVSPINELCRDMIARLEPSLAEAEIDLPVYWGNRNSAPFLEDTLSAMADAGVRRALAFVTSAYSSYSGCRQYLRNIEQSRAVIGDRAPQIDKLRVFFNHPGFIDPLVDGLAEALDRFDLTKTHVLFSAHSIPQSMADNSFYVAQVGNAMHLVCQRLGERSIDQATSSLAWQSRSGSPTVPWLEPDIVDAIHAIDADTYDSVVVVPVGFVHDHMEVVQDLDTAAARAAADRGFGFARVATPGSDARFIDMIVDLVRERIDGVVPVALGRLGMVPEQCNATCCPPPQRARTRP